MAAESLIGLSSMENDMKMLSSEKQIADIEKEREVHNNELKDTIDNCTILSSDLEKAMLTEDEVHTLLAEYQKLKNNNSMLLAEHGDLKAQLQSTINDLEAAKIDQHNEVMIYQEEKTTTLAKLQQVEASLKNLENQLEQQVKKNLEMQKTNEDLVLENSKLQNEILEMQGEKSEALASIIDLESKMVEAKRSLHTKIAALHEDKEATLLELHASNASAKNFESVVKKQNVNISSLQQANDELHNSITILIEESEKAKVKLQDQIEAMDKQLTVMRRSLHAKIAALQEEKDATLLELQTAQASTRSVDSVIEKQNETISSLQQANDELQKTITTLTEESEKAKAKLKEEIEAVGKQLTVMRKSLHAKIAALHEEKDATLSDLQASQASNRNFESVVKKLNEDISFQKQANDELQRAIRTLTEKLEQAKAQFQEELVEVRRGLHAKVAPLHEEKDTAQLKLQAAQASIRNYESVVEEQNKSILSQQHGNDELQKAIYTLTKQSAQTKAKLQDEVKAMEMQLLEMRRSLHAKIPILQEEKDATLLELQTAQASAWNIESVAEKKNETISSLQQANDELQQTITTLTEESEKAKAKLQEEIEAMDKQLTVMRKSLHAKIAALHEEKDAALSELQASQASVRNFDSVAKKKNEDISSLKQANDELQRAIRTLTEKSEQAKAQFQEELVEVRRGLHAKVAPLHEEKDEAQLKLQAAQASIRNYESVVEEQNKRILTLQQGTDELQKAIYTLTEQSAQTKAMLQEEVKAMEMQLLEMRRSLHAKIAVLQEENDATLLQLQTTQASARNIESVAEKRNETISSLQQANDDLQKTITTLTEESEKAKAKFQEEIEAMDKQLTVMRKSLHVKIAALHEEKDAALLELQASEASVRNFESVVKKQNEDISSQKQANDELQRAIRTLTKKSEQAKAQFQEELVVVRRGLHAKVAPLHEEKDAAQLKLQAAQDSISNYESVVEEQNKRILSLQQGNDELQKAIYTLTEQSAQTKATLQEEVKAMEMQLLEMRRSLHAKIAALQEEKDATLLELQTAQASARNIESVAEKQNETISYLQQANDDLQKTITTLTEKAKAKLHEEIEAMDKQLTVMRKSLHAKIAALHEEKDVALSELQASQASVRNFESVAKKQNEDISSLKQANDKLQRTIRTLTEKSEQAKAQFQEELVEVRRGLHARVAPLHEEKNAAQLKLQAAQASIRNLESVVEEQNERILSLQQGNDELQRAIYTLTEQSVQTKAMLQEEVKAMEMQSVEMRRSLHAKIAALQEEKDATLLELQTAQASARNIESVAEKQNETISSLQQANDNLKKTITTLTEESEKAKAKLQEEIEAMDKQLTIMRKSLHAKIAALHEEKDAALAELQASQASVRNFESVAKKQNEEISFLKQVNDELQRAISDLTEKSEQAKAQFQEQLVEVRRGLHAKVAPLHEEKDAAQLKLQAAQASVKNLESVVEEQNERILSLQQGNDELQGAIYTLAEQSVQTKAALQEEVKAMEMQSVEMRRSLHAKIAALQEEKDATLLELQTAQASARNVESVVEKQNETISSLHQANDELHKTITTLTEESEKAKAKLQGEIEAMDKTLTVMRKSLHAKIAALHEEKDTALLELQASQASVRNFESVAKKQNEDISSLKQANDELQRTIRTLTEKLEQAKAQFQEELVEVRRGQHAKFAPLHEEKDAAQLKLKAAQASIRNLQSVVEEQNERILSLQQGNDELQKAIYTLTEQSAQTKANLQEEVNAMEMQLLEMRRSLHAKIVASQEEKDATLLELQTAQASARDIKSVTEKQNETISSLQQANDDLQKTITTLTEESEKAKAKLQGEIEAMDKQLTVMRNSLHAKIAALHEEKDATLSQLQASQASVRNFESVAERQSEDISYLHQANDDLLKTICTMTEETEKVKAKLHEEIKAMDKQLVEMRRSLHAKIAALHEERDATLMELQASQTSVRNFESVIEKQNDDILSLRQANDDLQQTICTLTAETEKAKTQLQDEVKAMERQLVEMRRSLHAKIATLHEEKDAALLDLQASLAYVRNIDSVVEKHNKSISTQKQASDELQRVIHTLTGKSEQVKARFQEELVEVRRGLYAKVAALHEEKDATQLKLQAAQASIKNFESVVEEQNKRILSLQQGNDKLQRAIYTLTEQSAQTKSNFQDEVKGMEMQLLEMRSFHAKISVLKEEKDATLLELQTSQASVKNIESVVEKQNGTISSLQQANDVLQKEIGTLTEQSQQANSKLQEEVKAAQEERDMVISQFKQSEVFIKNLENEVARLIEELSVQLQKNSALDKQFKKFQAEMARNIVDLSLNTKALENTINVLSSEKTKVEEDLKILVQACSGNMSSMKEFQETVKQRITDDVTKLGPLYQSLGEVLSSYRKLQYAYDEMSARASQLEALKENQMGQIEKINQLKEEKVNTFMENAKLHKNVLYLEFQLQHVKQKLMENKWKEERFATTLVTSQAEIQNLEQLVSLLEETLEEVKEHAELGVLSLAEQLDKLESSFNQGFPRFVYRSSTSSSEEIKVLRKKLHDHLDQQKEILKKKEEVATKLRNKDKVLSDLVKNDVEARNLEKEVDEKESGGDSTNNTVTGSKRWPSLRRRRWRRNSYSC
ncbi:hypothetical protein EJB05_02719, partial [Eragrostis curvula]